MVSINKLAESKISCSIEVKEGQAMMKEAAEI